MKRIGQFYEAGKDKSTQRKEFYSFRKRAIVHIDDHKKYDTREEPERDWALIMETGEVESAAVGVSERQDLTIGMTAF